MAEKLRRIVVPELRLAGIYRYPVKSLSGQSASVLPVDQRGLQAALVEGEVLTFSPTRPFP